MTITLRRSLLLSMISGLAIATGGAGLGACPPGSGCSKPAQAVLYEASAAGESVVVPVGYEVSGPIDGIEAGPVEVAAAPVVQLAILLDTSGSMEGLIEQAKSELWNVVNDFALARRGKDRVRFEVALYEYGKSSIPAAENHLRMILPLTDDLDAVSAELFKLTTNGGEEYCGTVIEAATRGLSWSSAPGDLRFIVIAGNEPFTQGTVDYKSAVPAAVKRGIIVNTIHCGDRGEGERTSWKDGAVLGEGTYSFIDHNATAVHIPAPQDAEIVRLGGELNATYIAFGAGGEGKWLRQEEQDRNAAGASVQTAVQRAACKASDNYRNAGWDLVDAVKEGRCKAEEVKDEELPEDMKKMTPAERKAHVEKLAAKRAEVQGCIQKLEQERQAFVEAKRKEMAASTPTTLSSALIAAMRQQAEGKGFTYEK